VVAELLEVSILVDLNIRKKGGGVLTYLKKQLRVTVANTGRIAAILCKRLDSLLEVVQLLCKVEGADENLVPATTLVGERGQTLGSDPFKERNIRDVANALVGADTELCQASLLQRGSRVLDNRVLVVGDTVHALGRRSH